jgi:Ca-activated chloride channel family protein
MLVFTATSVGLIGCSSAPTTGEYAASNEQGMPALPGFDKLQQEQYEHFTDNAYQSAATDPMSTFSTDVNTASYSNVRRHLESNQTLPPKDAVRIAELINYFPYDYPNPTGADPVSFTLDLAPCPWQPKHHLARIGVKAKSIPASEMPPRNLVFLIDVSGSMDGPTRLQLVQKSLNLLIDTLNHNDTVSIVTYAGETMVKLSPTRGDMKSRIRGVVNALRSQGSTNGASGINLAYDQARASLIENGVNRVILCTDGDFNVGITSQGDLVRLIEQQRQSNVFLTVLGFGMGNLKDSTLEKLANHGNGHYAYIDSEAEAHKVFVEQGAALVTVAKDVKLQVHFNPLQVNAYRLIGYENRMLKNEDFKNDEKDAGDMGSGHTVTAFYEIVPVGVEIDIPRAEPSKYTAATKPNQAAQTGEWLTVKMRYKHPTEMTSQELVKEMKKEALGKPVNADFQFASAVAEWGLLLRDSPYKGSASYDRILGVEETDVAGNRKGHRNEFFRLVRLSQQYAGKANGGTAKD